MIGISSMSARVGNPHRIVPCSRVTLRGSPFKNPATVKEVLLKCVPPLSLDEAAHIVDTAAGDEVTVIVCAKNEAEVYCRNLVENGFEATVWAGDKN